MMKLLSIPVLLILFTGCSTPEGNTWLIRTNTDEISIVEAGIVWDGLDHEARTVFLSGSNPVGDFITTLGRKSMVAAEINTASYLHSSLIQNMKICWIINSAVIAYTDSLSENLRNDISEEDISNYGDLLGSIVWYSSSISGQHGPERLPDLPWNIAFAFDSMSSGSTVEIEGVFYTLDSITTSPQEMIEETLADTDRFTTFARSSLVESRLQRNLLSLKYQVLETLSIDSASVISYCTQRELTEDAAILATWEGGSISAVDFDGIAVFLSLGRPGIEVSVPWVLHNLANQARLTNIADLYATEYPDDYGRITQGGNNFAFDSASELLYSTNVTNMTEMSDSLVMAAYERMSSIPEMPQSRVFESVVVPAGILDDALELLENDGDLLSFGYPGYPEFLSSGHEFLSRPVYLSELPSPLDVSLFLLEEEETEWQRPVEVQEDLFLFYRLVEIIPSCPASFEQLEQSIRTNLRIHHEEQRTMEWMCELEASYQLQINNDILGKLPLDPSAWSEL